MVATGVPEPIRKKCVERREEDDDPADDAYGYSDLIDLSTISDKQWQVVSRSLPTEIAKEKKRFTGAPAELNRIRKKVMHPIRGPAPSEEEFQFVHELKRKLGFME